MIVNLCCCMHENMIAISKNQTNTYDRCNVKVFCNSLCSCAPPFTFSLLSTSYIRSAELLCRLSRKPFHAKRCGDSWGPEVFHSINSDSSHNTQRFYSWNVYQILSQHYWTPYRYLLTLHTYALCSKYVSFFQINYISS